jgi:hypothetical protein
VGIVPVIKTGFFPLNAVDRRTKLKIALFRRRTLGIEGRFWRKQGDGGNSGSRFERERGYDVCTETDTG